MKALLQSSKALLACRHAFIVSSSVVLLASCQKDVKQTPDTGLKVAAGTTQATGSLSAIASKIDTGGLVGWYSFDSGTLGDLSTYHNRIIFNNALPTQDRNGIANNAYHFNGSSSYMEVKNSPSLSPDKEVTLFVIAKFDDFYEGKCHGNRLIQKGYTDGVPGFYTVATSDDYYTHSMNCSQPVDKAHETFEAGFMFAGAGDTTEYVQTGHWYHLVFTYSHGTSKFYVDGVLTQTNVGGINPGSNSDDLFFGTSNKFNTEYPYWFNGSIDQIAIFNRALNETQVAKLSAY